MITNVNGGQKNTRIVAAILALGALFLTSLSVVVSAAEPVEIKIGYYESTGGLGQTGKTMEALIKSFADENPNVRVSSTAAAYGAFFKRLPVELAANVGPDVWLSDGVLVDQYAAQGFALDLTQRIEALPNANEYFGLESNRDPQGRIWAFPQGLQSSALFYNREMFTQAGVLTPSDQWTLADLRRAAQKLTRDTSGSGTTDQYGFRSFNHVTEGWYAFMRAFGGGALDETRRKSRFNDPLTIEALRYMVDMIHVDRCSPPAGGKPFEMFPQRLVAMQYGLYVRTFGANQAGLDYDVALLPTGPAGRFNPVIVNSWIVNAHSNSPKQQAAWDWVKYFSGERAQRIWAELGEAVPVSRKVATTVFMQLAIGPKNRLDFVRGLDHAAPLDPSPVWGQWVDAATKALAGAFAGTMSVNEAALNAHRDVQQVLNDFYR